MVNPTNPTSLRHALRSAAKGGTPTEERMEEAALIHAEEKMLDEEITSEEDEAPVDGDLYPVSIMKGEGDEEEASDDEGGAKTRYGLRKRRRPTGQDLERLERCQTSDEGGLARSSSKERLKKPSGSIDATAESDGGGTEKTTASTVAASPRIVPKTSLVPNPLALSAKASGPSETGTLPSRGSAKSATQDKSRTPMAVPCPLPAAPFEDAPEPVPSTERAKKVNFQQPSEIGRIRGFSIDMDCEYYVCLSLEFDDRRLTNLAAVGLDFPDDNSTAEGGRARAFSFECFAFGINADEPLPPLGEGGLLTTSEGSGHTGPRPRGDSIIFDPTSFQDGGILEQHALERSRASSSQPAQVKSSTVVPVPRPVSVPKTSTTPAPSILSIPKPVVTTSMIMTQASSSSTLNPTVGGNTISLELLNKDGRIGIYLPDDRKARIARFHAKRAKRIWRKRIKYDCRKKLADSRPRIKGRFVKRSDMDDE